MVDAETRHFGNSDRHRLHGLESTKFDLAIIGGGITGACLAYDAATRGMRVALFEKGDFGAATSSASSKLLHGGIRYLQHGRLDKVRESALERVYFQNLVPHLCRFIPFVIPSFRDLRKGRIALSAALLLYGAATAGQNRLARLAESRIPAARLVPIDELRSMAPLLAKIANINGGLLLPECHMTNSERMTFAFIAGAKAAGATVHNYTNVIGLRQSGKSVYGLIVEDSETGDSAEVSAQMVANCAGPWIRTINDSQLNNSSTLITGFSRGAHAVVRGLDLQCAIALPTQHKIKGLADRGGRHMFLIPWRGHTLLGTSYARHDNDLESVKPEETDLQQLIDGINEAAGQDVISHDNIVHAFAGIYPLVDNEIDSNTYQGTGEYAIIDHRMTEGISGYISVFGAKYTTARLLAEKACDQITNIIDGKYRECMTRKTPTPAGNFSSFDDLYAQCGGIVSNGVNRATIEHLVTNYGAQAIEVLRLVGPNREYQKRFVADRETIVGEAIYCARFEHIRRLEDFVFRRTGLGTLGFPGMAALETAATMLGAELGWSADRRREEIEYTAAQFPVSELRTE